MGSFATFASYAKNAPIPARPTISGTITHAEPHGYCTLPHVNAMTQALELAMISKFPLASMINQISQSAE